MRDDALFWKGEVRDVEKVVPIRQQMMFTFTDEDEIPEVNPAMVERAECIRYEKGLCRWCDGARGKHTPWCKGHFPWDPAGFEENF